MAESAHKQELRERITNMMAFLDCQIEDVTVYNEALVKRLIEKILVYDEKLTIEFKSGISVDVEA